MTSDHIKRPVVLCILDGWGLREETANNAIALAATPNWDRMWATAPHARIKTSGLSVGLPDGQMGNSEVGHMNIGAGRVVMQDLPRIDGAIADGSFAANQTLKSFIAKAKTTGGAVHIMGLLSPGGVHSHQDHMVAAAKVAAAAGLPVWLHGFLDGRDTPPQSAAGYVEKLESDLADVPSVRMGTISGRYFAMDRDKNWDRVQLAHAAIADAKGEHAATARAAIDASYAKDKTDEFVAPTVIDGYSGIQDGDAVLMINFRADRAREILTALADPDFTGFERRLPRYAALAGMVEYSTALTPLFPALFPAEALSNTLGEWVAAHGKRQLRIAETEKYAHVTFFLNGGREAQFDGEDRILVPSPKVATYDLQPEMSAPELTDKLVAAINGGTFDLIVVNYANPDMVGHTGILKAAMKAAETIDACIGRVADAVRAARGAMLISADHGNLELMKDPANDGPHTAHTTLEVPLVLLGVHGVTLQDGRLCDLAPTALALMGLPQPAEMSGHSLVVSSGSAEKRERAAQ